MGPAPVQAQQLPGFALEVPGEAPVEVIAVERVEQHRRPLVPDSALDVAARQEEQQARVQSPVLGVDVAPELRAVELCEAVQVVDLVGRLGSKQYQAQLLNYDGRRDG